MTYAQLYDSIQNLPLHICRDVVKKNVLSFTGVNSVKIFKTRHFTPDICRGVYLSPRSEKHFIQATMGRHVIMVAANQNRCWDRLIVVKELMHLLDGDEESVDTGNDFDRLLSELFIGPGSDSKTNSEFIAFWRALGMLAPEKLRQSEKLIWTEAKKNGSISADYEAALKFKIPQAYISFLFSERYEHELSRILDRKLSI
ncbi:hypothetical protein [Acetobacter indonesiensis]|uniref:hypothetical protein n=1 Tax=Acetobacter indonesiensis TaxID=104101 RepID=UPI0020A490C3|nr:hypothetical protein [Acetobacter indonesiensis]MCP1229839.1 hypothetical protein [Acetobacter indonesiensis]